MKKGINQWSLPVAEDFQSILRLSVGAGIPNLEACILPADKNQFPGVAVDPELATLFSSVASAVNAANYGVTLGDSADDLKKLRMSVEAVGAHVMSVTTLDLFRYTLTSPDPAVREAAVWVVTRMVDICAALGGEIVLIEPGVVTSALPYREAYRNCQESLRTAARYAEERNVTLALENVWGKFLMTPMEFIEMIDSLHSDAVGAYFDVANILAFGFPQDWIMSLGRRLKSLHFKDFSTRVGSIQGFCNPFDGDVDWEGVRASLRKIRYSGYIVAEVILPRVWQQGFIQEISRKLDWLAGER